MEKKDCVYFLLFALVIGLLLYVIREDSSSQQQSNVEAGINDYQIDVTQ